MKNLTPFLTQYYNLITELKRNGINVDNATESQVKEIQRLQEKALLQSGLTANELVLIVRCRANNIFTEVNTYSKRLRNL